MVIFCLQKYGPPSLKLRRAFLFVGIPKVPRFPNHLASALAGYKLRLKPFTFNPAR